MERIGFEPMTATIDVVELNGQHYGVGFGRVVPGDVIDGKFRLSGQDIDRATADKVFGIWRALKEASNGRTDTGD